MMVQPTMCFDAVEITMTLRRVSADDIEPGDLIFCRRPGWLTTLNRSAGDPWRHVGIGCWVDGRMSIVEVHDDLHTSRPIDDIADGYDVIGVARLDLAAGERSALCELAANDVGETQRYPWGVVALTGAHAEARRWLPSAASLVSNTLDRLGGSTSPLVHRLLDGLTCSSYVADRVARATGAVSPSPLVMPSDLWFHPLVSGRSIYSYDEADRPWPAMLR